MGRQHHPHQTKYLLFQRLSPQVGFLSILLVFLALTILHSLIVPITQGEDELAHYRYISFIAQHGRLPANYTEREQAWYRADWPPLYHLLVGWVLIPFDTTRPQLKDVGEAPHRRLVGEIFYPRLIIYTEDANWPWQDGILAWHIGRFISILFSAGALVFTYLTALEIPGLRFSHQFAIAVTALLAFTPRYLFTSAMLGDDSLFILLSAIFIWLLLRALRGDDRWWLYAVLGLVLGWSITTKYSTGLLPLAIIPVVLWRARQVGWGWAQSLGRIVLTWLFVLLGSIWWFAWIVYYFNTVEDDGPFFGLLSPLLASGPDVSMRRLFAFFEGGEFTGQQRPDAIAAGSFWDWLTYLFQTFWGVPVLEHDPLFPWAYLLLLLLCLLALVGLVQFWRTADSPNRITLAVLILIIALLFPFPILRYFLTLNVLETGQGRHILYPAAQAIPILLVLGWIWLGSRRHATRITSYLLLVPLLLLIWAIFQLIYMFAVYPAPLPVQTTTFRSSSVPQPLKHNFGDAIQFLGYDFQPDSEQAIINLTLFWKALKPVHQNYRTRVQLTDSTGQSHFTWLSHPLNGCYPTRAWDEGDIIRDTLPLPLAAVPANTYNIEIDLLRQAEDIPLNDEPFQIIQFDLPTTQPLAGASTLGEVDYRLWVDDTPARYRQTLPLSWSSAEPSLDVSPQWGLLGPDDVLRSPATTGDATAIFIVDADWPSGDYRLHLEYPGNDAEGYQTEPLLTVANEPRIFELPSGLTAQPGWIPVEANFANQIKLLGYVLPTRRVEAGGGLPLTLYWQSLEPVLGDYIVFDVLLHESQQVYGGYDRLPREYYSTILWAEGEVVEDGFAVPISPDAPPGVYDLRIGLYTLATGSPVSLPLIQDEQPIDVTSVVIGPIKIGGPAVDVTTTDPTPQVALNQPFSDQITLLGYSMTDENDQKSNVKSLAVTLFWRADATLNIDYTTFFHLRNVADENVAQKDRPPAIGRYPTSLWDVGEIIVDEVEVPLDGLSPGQYTPVVGLYDHATGARLLTPGIPENEIRLQSITLP